MTIVLSVHFIFYMLITALFLFVRFQELCAFSLPYWSLAVVDDYWMSYLLNKMYKRKRRKLQSNNHFTRSVDTEGLALCTCAEMHDAKTSV